MFGGLSLGWHLKRADITAGYNLYIPTGNFSPNATDNTGLGMWGNEFTLGTTVYLDRKRLWNASANFAMEFNTPKSGTNIQPGVLGTVEGGVGRTFYKKTSGPIPMILDLGATYYAQFKITGDSGSDIPPELRGFMDRVFALGPEFNMFIPGPRLTLLARYEPEFGARVHTRADFCIQRDMGRKIIRQTASLKNCDNRQSKHIPILGIDYLRRPTRRSTSWNRGWWRMASKCGQFLSSTRLVSRQEQAISRASRARSSSPRPS